MGIRDLIHMHLEELFKKDLKKVARVSFSTLKGDVIRLEAFGALWDVSRDGVRKGLELEEGPKAVLISMYLNHASDQDMELLPFKSFKELPGSMPYQDAFKSRAELVLVPHIFKIMRSFEKICAGMRGEDAKGTLGGDMALIVRPFPKIALGYVFYLPDEEFPASVTCLFSGNASSFMPTDGLADTAEQASKTIISML